MVIQWIVAVVGLLIIGSFPLIFHIIDKKRKETPCNKEKNQDKE